MLTRRQAFDRALAEDERAVELDPVAPGRRVGYAVNALGARRYDLALRQARAGLAIQPDLSVLRALVAEALLLRGQAERCLASHPNLDPVVRAPCLHSTGRRREARELADAKIEAAESSSNEDRTLDPTAVYRELAIYHAWVADVEAAVRSVERAFAASPNGVNYQFVQSGLFDRVRGDPRFSRRWEEITGEV